MQSSKDQQGEIRKPLKGIMWRKTRKTKDQRSLQENQRYQGNRKQRVTKEPLDEGERGE